MCVYMYIYTHIYPYIYIYMHIYTHIYMYMCHIYDHRGVSGLELRVGAGAASRLCSQHLDNAAMWLRLRHRRWPCPASEARGQSKSLSGFLPAGKVAERRSLCHVCHHRVPMVPCGLSALCRWRLQSQRPWGRFPVPAG